jgi:hypothetical protein
MSTLPFTISRSELAAVILQNTLRRTWWVFAICIGLAIVLLRVPGRETLAIVIALYYPAASFGAAWYQGGPRVARLMRQERVIRVEGDRLEAQTTAGARSEMLLSEFVRARETPTHVLLYITGMSFIPIPKRAIRGPADLEELRQALRRHGLLP